MLIDITKEKILQAASTSDEVKKVLENLFPELFPAEINLRKLASFDDRYLWSEHKFRDAGLPVNAIQVRMFGNYMYKAFFLDNTVTWSIEEDSEGDKVLVPTLK